MDVANRDTLLETLEALRKRLDRSFGPDTAAQVFHSPQPSTGHCAAVATIVCELLGGEMVSTLVEGHSHWLNRLKSGGRDVDVDLTGDQFGRPALQVADAGEIYPDTRVRSRTELTDETLARALLLAQRAELAEAAQAIEEQLRKRSART